MNHNRKRREAEARERRLREAALNNAVLVDSSALAPYESPIPPDFVQRGYYLEAPFTCASCGSDQVWTAAQQKWWYEVAKGSIYSRPKLCRTCRRDARLNKGKAHPLQAPLHWYRRIRDDLEPDMAASGWYLVTDVERVHLPALAYGRDNALVRFRWDCGASHSTLNLERLDDRDEDFRILAAVECDTYEATHGVLEQRYDEFLAAARQALGLVMKPGSEAR